MGSRSGEVMFLVYVFDRESYEVVGIKILCGEKIQVENCT